VNRALVAVALVIAFCGSGVEAQQPSKQTLEIYKQKCQLCHKADGTGVTPEMSLSDGKWNHGSSVAEVRKVITEGVKGKAMMPYGKQFSPEEIDALARYVRTFDKNLKPEPAPAK
jgi:mono/diheme cytochrome c family protein